MYRISRKVEDLGLCVIDVYRASGDLHESYAIKEVRTREDGAMYVEGDYPDARYGVNQPENPTFSEDNPPTPIHLVKVVEKWDRNGHQETTLTIHEKGDSGNWFVNRPI